MKARGKDTEPRVRSTMHGPRDHVAFIVSSLSRV